MPKLNTFLSEYVWYVLVELCDRSKTQENSPHLKWNYINRNFVLDWNKIGLLFGDMKDDEDILKKPEAWFCNTIGKVWDVIHEAGLLLKTVSNLKTLPLWELCKWTGAADDIADFFLLHLQGDEENKLQVLLHLTALLERSLGNAFLLKGHSVPHLLKDLLNTPEIQQLLGKVPVTFVQILMGSPKGLNVRNVVWHGFISPCELHPHLAAVFFILIPSLGNRLTVYQTIHRLQITDFMIHTEHISDVFPYIDEELYSISNIISECEYISLPHKSVWRYSFSLYIKQMYGQCVELFLPQLEHVLRQLFCDVNDCPHRIVTAESTSLYTTLDEILASSLPSSGDKTNKIQSVLGEGLSVLLNDILSDMAGPRLRDRISHGECCLKYLPKDLANYVYCAGLCVALKAVIYKSTKMKCNDKESGEQSFKKNVRSGTQAFTQKLIKACDMYTSRYHILSRLIQSIKHIINKVDQWSKFALPADFVYAEEMDSTHVTSLQNCLFGNSDISLSATSCKISDSLNKIRPKTLFRPRSEVELVSLLKNVIEKIEYTEIKINECICIKYKQWEEHSLRSRNRLTFQRMLQVLPDLQVVILCILGIITSFIQNITSLQQGRWKFYLRFSKGMLRLAENMASFCTMEKNRWLEAHKLASEFSKISVQFLHEEPYLLIYKSQNEITV